MLKEFHWNIFCHHVLLQYATPIMQSYSGSENIHGQGGCAPITVVGPVSCPRSHSTRAISNAKIKTVKLTVVVVAGYLICSAPYVCIQLYVVLGNPTINMSK